MRIARQLDAIATVDMFELLEDVAEALDSAELAPVADALNARMLGAHAPLERVIEFACGAANVGGGIPTTSQPHARFSGPNVRFSPFAELVLREILQIAKAPGLPVAVRRRRALEAIRLGGF